MLAEHDRVVLTEDFRDRCLRGGDVGTIVHVHRGGEAFEVDIPAFSLDSPHESRQIH